MKKYFLLCHILLFTLCGFAQLKIGTGSTFKTSGTVSVVLTDADLENNGSFIQDTFGSLRFSGIDFPFIFSKCFQENIFCQNFTNALKFLNISSVVANRSKAVTYRVRVSMAGEIRQIFVN